MHRPFGLSCNAVVNHAEERENQKHLSKPASNSGGKAAGSRLVLGQFLKHLFNSASTSGT